ncbi:hypothetical protein [Streptomyces olivaceiscleroticus]
MFKTTKRALTGAALAALPLLFTTAVPTPAQPHTRESMKLAEGV